MLQLEHVVGAIVLWSVAVAVAIAGAAGAFFLSVWLVSLAAEYVWRMNGTKRKVKFMLALWPSWKYDLAKECREGPTVADWRLKYARELMAEMDPKNELKWRPNPQS